MTTKVGAGILRELDELRVASANDVARPYQDRAGLDSIQRAFGEIEAALDELGAPAFLVSEAGAVVLMSASARALDVRELAQARRSLAVVAKACNDETWEVRPIPGSYSAVGRVIVLRGLLREGTDDDGIGRAKHAWRLTKRQAQVLDLIARGQTNALISDTLGIKESTVEFHVTALFDKAGVCNRATLIVRLLELQGRR